MTNPYGPWATAIDAGGNVQLSSFWRQRLTMLVPTSQTSSVLSRQSLMGLVVAAFLTCVTPTFLAAPAVAEQEKVSQEKDKDQESGAGGRESAASVSKEAISKAKSPPKELTVDLGKGIKLELVLIPAGEFLMGSPDSDKDVDADEHLQHRVRITKPFYLGKYLVTQEQWEAVMGDNPSHFKGPKNPEEMVSWEDCQQFLKRLNDKVGGGKFQLPSEAQWEYACRAGSETRYCFGDDSSKLGEYAWYDANSGNKSRPVGGKKPNAWGLSDMHGNVWEWCQDWRKDGYYKQSPVDDPTGAATGSSRVYRGGCWIYPAWCCRSAYRGHGEPGLRCSGLGFRVSRVPAETVAETRLLSASDQPGETSAAKRADEMSPASNKSATKEGSKTESKPAPVHRLTAESNTEEATASDRLRSSLRSVELRFLGGDKKIPLAGVDVNATNGYGKDQKKFGPFRTDASGTVRVSLPNGSYSLHLESEKGLPYLPVEELWENESRGPPPDLTLAITALGVEKWLRGKRRLEGYEPPAKAGDVPRVTYTLLFACKLVLRAVDAETGKGLPGAEFYTENAVGEEWAHRIDAENVGARYTQDKEELDAKAYLTDNDGYFRRLVGANAGFKYGVTAAPAGYKPIEPALEVEIDIPYGKPYAEHVFKFRRMPVPKSIAR